MRSLVLKLAATVLTVGATVGSAVFVSAHIKNAAAPLQPPVLAASGAGALVVVTPPIQPTDQPPVASTYAS